MRKIGIGHRAESWGWRQCMKLGLKSFKAKCIKCVQQMWCYTSSGVCPVTTDLSLIVLAEWFLRFNNRYGSSCFVCMFHKA